MMMKKLLLCFLLLSQFVMKPVQAEAWFTGLVAGAGLTLFAFDGARDYKKFKRHEDRKKLQGNEKAQSDVVKHEDHAKPAGFGSFLPKNKEALIASFKDIKQFFNYYCKEIPKKKFGFFHVGLSMMAASLLQAKAGRDYEGEIAKIKLDYGKKHENSLKEVEQAKALRLEQNKFNEEQLQAWLGYIKDLNQRIADLEAQPSVMPLRNEEADELIRLRQVSEDLRNRILSLQRELAEYVEWDKIFFSQQEEVTQKWILIEELKRQLNEIKGQLNTSKEQRVNLEAEIARLQSDLAVKAMSTSNISGRGRGISRGRGALSISPSVQSNVKKETSEDEVVVVRNEGNEAPVNETSAKVVVISEEKKEILVNDQGKVDDLKTFLFFDLENDAKKEAPESKKEIEEGEPSSSVSSDISPAPSQIPPPPAPMPAGWKLISESKSEKASDDKSSASTPIERNSGNGLISLEGFKSVKLKSSQEQKTLKSLEAVDKQEDKSTMRKLQEELANAVKDGVSLDPTPAKEERPIEKTEAQEKREQLNPVDQSSVDKPVVVDAKIAMFNSSLFDKKSPDQQPEDLTRSEIFRNDEWSEVDEGHDKKAEVKRAKEVREAKVKRELEEKERQEKIEKERREKEEREQEAKRVQEERKKQVDQCFLQNAINANTKITKELFNKFPQGCESLIKEKLSSRQKNEYDAIKNQNIDARNQLFRESLGGVGSVHNGSLDENDLGNSLLLIPEGSPEYYAYDWNALRVIKKETKDDFTAKLSDKSEDFIERVEAALANQSVKILFVEWRQERVSS